MNWVRRLCIPLLLLLCGCSSIEMHKEQPEYSVGVVMKALYSPYWLDMKSGVEQAVADYGVDLILLYPKGEQEAKKRDVQLLTVDTRAMDTDLPYIGSDNYLFGKIVAQYLNEQLGEDASLFMLFGPENQSSIIERYQAIKLAIESMESGQTMEDVLFGGELLTAQDVGGD